MFDDVMFKGRENRNKNDQNSGEREEHERHRERERKERERREKGEMLLNNVKIPNQRKDYGKRRKKKKNQNLIIE